MITITQCSILYKKTRIIIVMNVYDPCSFKRYLKGYALSRGKEVQFCLCKEMAAEMEKLALLVVLLLRQIPRRRKAGRTKTRVRKWMAKRSATRNIPQSSTRSSQFTSVGHAILLDDR